MANNYMGNMTFGVNFRVDTKALDQLDAKFDQVKRNIDQMMQKGTATKDNSLIRTASEAKKAYENLYAAMQKAYNPKLGQFDLSKINSELAIAKTNLVTVANSLNNAGQNVNTVLSTLMGNKLMIKETNQFLDKMAVTFGNTIRWSITTKIINTITGSIQKAFYFTKDLDRSLNDIRIVTGKSADEMERFAKQATNAAQALGRTTTDYTKASLLYYQQGLNDKEVAARTETTLKAANVTGQSTSEVSEQLTAVWNGYKVSAEETEKYVDKLAKVAASTASDLEELSTGMSKVASAANMMGVDIDQLNAQLSTVISVTRQAPETIGAAFKTIYSRMSTIKAGGIDEEDGATLTSYTEKMNQFGISVLDSNGKLRDMGSVIEEIGDKWNTFSREAQVGLAQAMGGTRQYSNLTALFENWDKYQAALKTSQNATGTLAEQQSIYLDSIAAHFDQLTAEAEKFYQAILDEDALKDFADAMKFILKEINGLVKGIGGGANAITNILLQLGGVFSNQIGGWLGQKANTRAMWKVEKANVNAKETLVNQLKQDPNKLSDSEKKAVYGDQNITFTGSKANIKEIAEANGNDTLMMSSKVLQEQATTESQLLNIAKVIGTEKYNQLTTENQQLAILQAQKENYETVKEYVEKELKNYEDIEGILDLDNQLQDVNVEQQQKIVNSLQQQTKELKEQYEIKEQNLNTDKKHLTDIENIQKHSGSNISVVSLLNKDGTLNKNKAGLDKTGTAFKENPISNTNNTQLKQLLSYYNDAVTKAKELNLLEGNQKNLQAQIGNIMKGRVPDAAELKSIETQMAPILEALEVQRVKIAKEANGLAIETEKIKKNEDEIQAKLEQETEELGRQQKLEGNFGEIRQNIHGLATGELEDTTRKADQLSGQINSQIANGQRIAKFQLNTRKTMASLQMLTGVVGSLNTMFKDGATGMDKYEASFSGLTSVISGGASIAFGPLGGMIAGAGMSLVKGVLDLTGASDTIAKLLKSDAEKYAEFEKSVEETTQKIQKQKEKLSEQAISTQEYHNNVKDLEAMRAEWDKIVAKKQAGITLTSSEQSQYESMLNKIINANEDVVTGYDSQHNAIVDLNTALDKTLEKLSAEYKIAKDIAGISSQDVENNVQTSYNLAQEILAKQAENRNKITGTAELQVHGRDLYNSFDNVTSGNSKEKFEKAYQKNTGQVLNSNQQAAVDEYFGIAENYTNGLSNSQKTLLADFKSHLKSTMNMDATEYSQAYLAFIEKYGDDVGDQIKEIFEQIQSNFEDSHYLTEMENMAKDAGNFYLPDISSLTNIVDDYFDEDYKAAASYFSKENQSKIQEAFGEVDSIVSTFDDVINSTNDNLDILESIPASLRSTLVETSKDNLQKIADKIKNNPSLMKDYDLSEEIDKEQQNLLRIIQKTSIDNINQYNLEINNLGKIKSNKDKLNIEEYQNQIDNIQKQVYDTAIKIVGKDNAENFVKNVLGTDYNNQNLVEANDIISQKFGDVRTLVSGKDVQKYIDFANSTGDYSSYGSDFLSQFEGFKHENYGTALFSEALPNINSQLDEIKNLSLDGSALDEEKFEALNEQLFEYQGHLQDVQTEVGILNDKNLYGTQVWYESLERVEKELRAAQDKALLGERGQLVENLELDTADAEQQLKDLTSKDYEIIVHLDTEGEDTYQTALKEIENMQKSLSYVGEEGKIAAENVYDFLNAFPEMNDMIKELNNDGSISLTKEQIQLVKERSEANITAILAEREIELKADLDRMQAEKDRIENQKTLIKEELSNWGQKEFNKEQFVKNFTEFYGDSADTQLKITETDNDYMNDDTYDTSVAIAKYWDQASTKAAESYRAFAESVIQNNLAIENNNKADLMHAVTAGSGIDKINYESQKTQTEELLNDIQNLGNESIDQQKALLKQMLASLDKEGDLIDSSIEKQQNRMIALNAQGLAAIKNAGDLGKKTKEAAWEAKHLYDYYHDVNKELDFINQKLTVLQKKQKLLEGSALLKNLKLQSKEYENQIKYLQQKRGIQEGYQQELQTRQKDELGNKGLAAYGVTFDKNGYIENYAEIAKKLQEGQHDKESVEDYQNFINQVKTYEENLKLALDLEGQLYDVVAKRQELQSKAVEERVKMILDVSEARKKYMEFTKELGNWKVNLIINPDQTAVDAATAKAAESFVEDSITAMEKSAKMVKKGNSAVDRLKAGDFDVDKKGNKTDYVKFNGQKYKMEDLLKLEEDVDKFADAASQSAADIQQAYQNTLDAYSNAMKELNDWDKRVLAKYDMINSVYDHAEKLTELWYGNDSLEAKIMLTANQQEKTDNLYAKAKEANEQVKEDWDIYQDAVLQGNEKLAEEAYDAWGESIQNLQSLTEQFAEQRKKQLTDELDLAAKIVETQLYGGKSRDEFKNSWELINKQAETYLDTINAQFGVTQLENKYLQAINKSIGNTKSQEKLNKIMNEEMKMLKEKDKLTKYDLERAEAKYDLTLKQMALEEARDNKTNLRLRRDSQGNYTYQYVADENDVLKAQNDVDIAKNNLYNMDRDRAQEMTEKQLSAEEEYAQKYADLQEQFIDDEEGRLAAEAELYDAYYGENGILTGIMNERGIAFENLNESIDESLNGTGEKTVLGSFEKLRQNLPEEISKLAPALDPSIKTVMDKWTNKETGVASAYKILTDDTKQFFEDYKADIEQFAKDIDQDSTFGKVRTTFDTVKTKVDEFKASAAEADTAIGQLNSTGSKFSLNTLITDFETLASDLGGTNNENGLIYRINKANSDLMELVNPEEKKNNFKEIRESLAKIRGTLQKNKDKFDWSLNEIDKWKQAVVGHAQDAETEIGLVKNALDALADKKVTVTVETVYTTKGSPSKESGGNSGGGGDTQNLDNLKGNDKKEPVATVYNVKNLNNSSGGNYTFEDKSAAEAYVKQYPDAGPVTTQQVYKGDGVYLYKNIVTHSGMNSLPIVAKIPDFDQWKKYDTGGYTGAWGDQGKLAMLHEKELVLNKEDTENILDAVDLIRQIDMKQMQMNMMENYITALQRVQDKYGLESSQPTQINQNITINADFPDASDRDEIKAAFDSLVNLASQRAYTKRH